MINCQKKTETKYSANKDEKYFNTPPYKDLYIYYLKGFSYTYRKIPEIDRALEYTEKGLELRKKIGDELDIAFSLLMLGFLLTYTKSEIERGLEKINQALELGKRYDNTNSRSPKTAAIFSLQATAISLTFRSPCHPYRLQEAFLASPSPSPGYRRPAIP